MKIKRYLIKKKTILFVFIFLLCLTLVKIVPNSINTHKSIPKTSVSHLIWEKSFSHGPDYIAISDDGEYIAAASMYYGENVMLIDAPTSQVIWNYSMSSTSINGIDMSANGEYVIVGCHDNYVYVFNNTPDTSKTPFWIFNTGEPVMEVAISADGNYAIAGTSGTNYVILFNVTNPSDPFIWNSDAPTDGINCLAISSNGSYFAAGAFTTLYMYNTSRLTPSVPQWAFSESGFQYKVAISANGKYVVAGGSTGYLHMHDSSSINILWDDDLSGDILSIDMSDDGEYFVVGGKNGICSLYNKTGPTAERDYTVDSSNYVNSVSISKDGNYVAAGYNDPSIYGNTVYFYERTSSNALWTYRPGTSIGAVVLSSDGSYLAASEGSIETTLYFFTTLTTLPDPYSLSTSHAKVGTTFIYEIIEWNQTLGDSLSITLSDIDSSAGVGLQRCYEITQITKMSNHWIIDYKAWNWGMNFNSPTPYSDSLYVYVYPVDEGTDVDYIHPDLMNIIPKPVETYLEGIDWCSESSNSGLNYSYQKSVGLKIFDLTVEYSSEGFLNSMIWTYSDVLLLNVSYMGERIGGVSGDSPGIPFGEFFLLFTVGTIVVLILLGKRKIQN